MKNLKTFNNKNPLTDKDLEKGKDFEKVLKGAKSGGSFQFGGKHALGLIVVASSILAVYFLQNKEVTKEPFISAPIASADVELKKYKLNAGKGGKIEHPETGSSLEIPVDAFIDAQGNLVSGEVEIHYREFHNVAEIFLSGIPMTYDSAGQQYNFQSAGMFEILAYKGDEPIYLKPDKSITVNMASAQTGDQFNFYKLDTVNKNWKFLHKDSSAPQFTEAEKEIILELEKIQKIMEEQQQTNPIKPGKANPERYNIELVTDAKEFPELAIYKGIKFEISPEEKNFDPALSAIEWDDVSIKRGTKENQYNITFVKENKSYTFECFPVVEANDFSKAMKDYEIRFNTYRVKLSQLEKQKQIEQEKLAAIQNRFREQVAKRDSIRQTNAFIMMEVSKTEQVMYRSFQINELGIFNSDCPLNLPSGQNLMASYYDENNQKLDVRRVYLLDKKRNGVFTYSRPGNIQFNPSSENFLIGITASREIVVFKKGEFSKIKPESKEFKFKMEKLTSINDPAELMEIINS